jgi:hypothetical protein
LYKEGVNKSNPEPVIVRHRTPDVFFSAKGSERRNERSKNQTAKMDTNMKAMQEKAEAG